MSYYNNLKSQAKSFSVPIEELNKRFGQKVTIYKKTIMKAIEESPKDDSRFFQADAWLGRGSQTIVETNRENYEAIEMYLMLPMDKIVFNDVKSVSTVEDIVIPKTKRYTPDVGDKVQFQDNENSYEYVIDEVPRNNADAYYLVNIKLVNMNNLQGAEDEQRPKR